MSKRNPAISAPNDNNDLSYELAFFKNYYRKKEPNRREYKKIKIKRKKCSSQSSQRVEISVEGHEIVKSNMIKSDS